MLVTLSRLIAACALAALSAQALAAETWVRTEAQTGDFPLVHAGRAAKIVYAEGGAKVVEIAANDLAADIERVTGIRPEVSSSSSGLTSPAIFIGTLGKSPLIDGLVRAGKLNASDLTGQWERFVVSTVADPHALVIAGSDRRGAAFGVYELSQAIGVSPWHWWADVTPSAKQEELYVARGTRHFGPPSVQYRGIFLNDEDWGLQPWAAKTFDPATGNIGPKTYAKVFELLLRLKANTLWPAMHPGTAPFNAFPQNKQLADDYAIVMGSSHAEPMLRNNVGEWTEPHDKYNYVTNRDGVRVYWEERVRSNARFENIYTIGIRGIHDSHMQGPKTDTARARLLEQVFADQRAMLTRHVSPRVDQIPQIFVAYKEVLDLYRKGLRVPEDVTIVWPDDNFGYIRSFATESERTRSGGFGVYYHLSYLGRPLAYLWLSTTPPALICEEMHKAYEHGARKLWIANVGDLKPAEIGTEFFLQMAWDANRWRHDTVQSFLVEWATREFGAAPSRAIADIMADYYRLNYSRRPEHLQWWLPKESPRPSPLSKQEIDDRLSAFADMRGRAERLYASIPPTLRDAYFQLVLYPVRGSALANERYFAGELSLAERAVAADGELKAQTRKFNEEIAGGKWRHMMALEPADGQWASMRIAPWEPVRHARKAPGPSAASLFSVAAADFTARRASTHASWEAIAGLGQSGRAVTIFPATAPSQSVTAAVTEAARLDYDFNIPESRALTVEVHFVPTHPLRAGRGLRIAIGIDDQPLKELIVNTTDGSPAWAQAVLDNNVTGTLRFPPQAPGLHRMKIYMINAGVVLDRIVIR